MHYVLYLKINFENPRPVSFQDFNVIINQALKVVLGECGASKPWKLVNFDSESNIAEIQLEKTDLHLIWAALTVYGCHFGQKLANCVQKVVKVE